MAGSWKADGVDPMPLNLERGVDQEESTVAARAAPRGAIPRPHGWWQCPVPKLQRAGDGEIMGLRAGGRKAKMRFGVWESTKNVMEAEQKDPRPQDP